MAPDKTAALLSLSLLPWQALSSASFDLGCGFAIQTDGAELDGYRRQVIAFSAVGCPSLSKNRKDHISIRILYSGSKSQHNVQMVGLSRFLSLTRRPEKQSKGLD